VAHVDEQCGNTGRVARHPSLFIGGKPGLVHVPKQRRVFSVSRRFKRIERGRPVSAGAFASSSKSASEHETQRQLASRGCNESQDSRLRQLEESGRSVNER